MNIKVDSDFFDGPEFFVVGGTLVLFLLLISEIIDWQKYITIVINPPHKRKSKPQYGYAEHNGPQKWKDLFPHAAGENQSPVNIITNSGIAVNHCGQLKWSEQFSTTPDVIRMNNDGHTVTLYPRWWNGRLPTITGGPLENVYKLDCIKFRWGANDKRGSEHMIDGTQFAMEMQIFFARKHAEKNFELENELRDPVNTLRSLVVVSLFYKCSKRDNHYLEYITSGIQKIKQPNSHCYLQPFPLTWIAQPFELNFFTYTGSLSFPPCSEGVVWILQPEPMGISPRQINKFRRINNADGYIQSNCRPVQIMNNRELYYYE